MEMMELEETIEDMLSSDYKRRFIAEYNQLKIRCDKLRKMVDNWDNLNFKPTCEKEIYELQLYFMLGYLGILNNRAEIEGIDLQSTI